MRLVVNMLQLDVLDGFSKPVDRSKGLFGREFGERSPTSFHAPTTNRPKPLHAKLALPRFALLESGS